MDEATRTRRRARYERRQTTNAARSAPRTRPCDIAPRRATDGLKPDHAKRGADIALVMSKAPREPRPVKPNTSRVTEPMTDRQREAAYLAQSGGKRLTARQQRQLRRMHDRPLSRIVKASDARRAARLAAPLEETTTP